MDRREALDLGLEVLAAGFEFRPGVLDFEGRRWLDVNELPAWVASNGQGYIRSLGDGAEAEASIPDLRDYGTQAALIEQLRDNWCAVDPNGEQVTRISEIWLSPMRLDNKTTWGIEALLTDGTYVALTEERPSRAEAVAQALFEQQEDFAALAILEGDLQPPGESLASPRKARHLRLIK